MPIAFVPVGRQSLVLHRPRPQLQGRQGRRTVSRTGVTAARRHFGRQAVKIAVRCDGGGAETSVLSSSTATDAGKSAEIRHWFRPVPVESGLEKRIARAIGKEEVTISREDCFNVQIEELLTVDQISRLERSRRYVLHHVSKADEATATQVLVDLVHDRMTEQVYPSTLQSFESGLIRQPTRTIPVLSAGRQALEEVNDEEGLGFDDWDLDYYLKLFETIGRDPTNVELFDLAQSNSEHSRHWFFKGKLVIDGVEQSQHLFDVVRDTLRANPNNSVIAFSDNSSTIRGFPTPCLQPTVPGEPSNFEVIERDVDVLFTAETHNFPSGVAPFPGAETGAGGRIRDTAATGTGSLTIAGTAGYSVGNLCIEGYEQPWEDASFQYPENLASPLRIAIDASNGASDYGNKFGEPVINGFARTYGIRSPNGERREYVKPIMFSGGMGQMDHRHAEKSEGEVGMCIVKVGGPAYRIGMGGGAASSMMQGENRVELDFNAVQRGDAEMEQKAYRVLRHCVEMGAKNPIVSLHDQGAGGNCNVVKELIYPQGATINLRSICVGDQSLSALEIWGAEYQEQFGLLLRQESMDPFTRLCEREKVQCAVLGIIDGKGKIVLYDSEVDTNIVDLDLESVLGDLPQKTFYSERQTSELKPLELPDGEDLGTILDRVLRLMTVGSKRFLTTKVDRSVTGLVAQQQCVGPLQLPVCDYGVTANSPLSVTGSATAIGERPNLTSLSPAAMARMTVGEMITNIAGIDVTDLGDIRCEGNWMWAAKLEGEGAALYDAAVAMRDVMIDLGIAVDGGKDSLSMAARCPTPDGMEETAKAPGTLVVTGYCSVEDVGKKLTPDLKQHGDTKILLVDLADGKRRLGGSALAQVYSQLGDDCPDMESSEALRSSFETVQALIAEGIMLSYHDVSDGGLIVGLLEMAFAGNCGLDIRIDSARQLVTVTEALFAEELGMLVEVMRSDIGSVMDVFESAGVVCEVVGETRTDSVVNVIDGERTIFTGDIRDLRDTWEATSFELDKLQANPACVEAERKGLWNRTGLQFSVSYQPRATDPVKMIAPNKPKVAVVRQEGSNGDREMVAAFHLAGFEVADVSMSDLGEGRTSLQDYRGVAFVGGFSYADVLDSAKGWAGTIRYRSVLQEQFQNFYAREDTFSLGVCNGCQLMALLGIVPFEKSPLDGLKQPRFVHNESGRYESRFSAVRLEDSPSIMLKGMEGSTLGVWVSHGEGRLFAPDEEILQRIRELGLVALTYVDDQLQPTMEYPMNPNGSAHGIAGTQRSLRKVTFSLLVNNTNKLTQRVPMGQLLVLGRRRRHM